MSKVYGTRIALMALAALRAAFWGAAIAVSLFAAGTLVQWLMIRSAPGMPRSGTIILAVVGGAITIGAALWRSRFAWSVRRVALWIEEQAPQLKYALVTVMDPQYAHSPARAALISKVEQVDLKPHLLAAARRALWVPAVLLIAAVSATAVLPTARDVPMSAAQKKESRERAPNRLLHLTATLTPPAYTHRPTEHVADPETLSGLIGTQVVLTGQGTAEGIVAQIDGQSMTPDTLDAEQSSWRLAFVLPGSPAALKLTDGAYGRLVVLDPRADEVPVLKLRQPVSDISLREATGTLVLEAELSDDIGLAHAAFEYIRAAGEGEGNFTFQSGSLGAQRFDTHPTTGRLRSTVPFARFNLQPGDQLSVRAVASDTNTFSGPGKGYSETRVIRIARQENLADIDVNPAPPAFDNSLMSLRMLIIATEKLDQRRRGMPRTQFVEQTQPLARQSEVIRNKIKEFIDEQSQGGDFPVSPLLNTALAAMWDASRSLGVAETGEALPDLREAHAAMKKLASAAKYHFRGQASPAAVDIDSVRMKGEEQVRATGRAPRAAHDTTLERFSRRYRNAVELLEADPARGHEALTLLRVEALQKLPPLAEALEQALSALRDKQDPAAALIAARAIVAGKPKVHDGLSSWTPLP